MKSHRIFETDQFQKDLKLIALSGHRKVSQKLFAFVYPQLREHPHLGPHIKKLRGFEPDTWKYRIGAWRFFYGIDDKEEIVYMLAASHRSSAYS